MIKNLKKKIDTSNIFLICILIVLIIQIGIVVIISKKEDKEAAAYTESDKGNYEFSYENLSNDDWKYRIILNDENTYGRYLYINNKYGIFGTTNDITSRRYIKIDIDDLSIKMIDGVLWLEINNNIIITTNFTITNNW